MGAVTHGFQSAHGLGCVGDAFVNVTVVTQAEGDMGTNVFEVAAEGNLPAGDCDRGYLFKVVV